MIEQLVSDIVETVQLAYDDPDGDIGAAKDDVERLIIEFCGGYSHQRTGDAAPTPHVRAGETGPTLMDLLHRIVALEAQTRVEGTPQTIADLQERAALDGTEWMEIQSGELGERISSAMLRDWILASVPPAPQLPEPNVPISLGDEQWLFYGKKP